MTSKIGHLLRYTAIAAMAVSLAAAQGVDSIAFEAFSKVAVDPQGNLLGAEQYSASNDTLHDLVWAVFRYDPQGVRLGILPGSITGASSVEILAADPHGGVYLGGQANIGGLLLARVSDAKSARPWSTPLAGDSLHLMAAAFDTQDNLVVMGRNPAAGSNNIRIVKLDKSTGVILADYRFGTPDAGPYGLATDPAGAVYVAGFDSAGAFVTKIDAALQKIVYTTHIKGGDPSLAYDLAVAPDGSVFVAGQVLLFGDSNVFPTTPGAFQTAPEANRVPFQGFTLVPSSGTGFVARLDPGGALMAATLLGGNYDDSISFIRVDAAGSPTVIGYAGSADFPATGAFRTICGPRQPRSIFVTRLDPLLTRVLSSALLPQKTLAAASGLAPDNSLYISTAPYTEPGRALHVSPDAGSSPVACIVNGASYLVDRGIAPGQLITVFGRGLGPDTLIAPDDSQQLPFSAGGTSVRIGGFPAALLAVGPNQINTIVPFEIVELPPAQPVAIEILRDERVIYTWPVSTLPGPAVPLLHFDAAGQLDISPQYSVPLADVVNADGTRNSAANPAAAGTTITIFATGFGSLANNPTDGAPGSIHIVQYPMNYPPNFPFPTIRDIPVVTRYGNLVLPLPTPIHTIPGRTNAVLQVTVLIPLNFPAGQLPFQIGPLQSGTAEWSGFFYVK
jgi:uncharacterized protein (TIGR03437 family)